MAQLLSLSMLLRRIRLPVTDSGHISRATVATLAVRAVSYSWWQRSTWEGVQFLAATADESSPVPKEFHELAKLALIAPGDAQKDLGLTHVFLKHEPGLSTQEIKAVAQVTCAFMEQKNADLFLTGVINLDCDQVSVCTMKDDIKSPAVHAATTTMRDFHVDQFGAIGVVSGGFAAFVDRRQLRRAILARAPALVARSDGEAAGISVGPGDLLTRIQRLGNRPVLAVFHAGLKVTRVYDQCWQVVAEMKTPNFVMTALTENRGQLLVVQEPTPSGSARRLATGSDEFKQVG